MSTDEGRWLEGLDERTERERMDAATTPTPETPAERLIAAERRRQVESEGWTAEHDAGHGPDVLRRAARCYETHPGDEAWQDSAWPWDESWWKPKDHLSNLIRAGALYQAAADIGLPEQEGLHRDAIARCARKIDAILAHPTVAAAVVQARAEGEATHRDLVSRLGFGDNISEPMANNDTIVAWFEERGREADEWVESQRWRDECYAAGHPDDEDCWEHDPTLRLERATQARAEDRARIEAALPDECWTFRSTDTSCVDLIGGTFANGGEWAEDMCCLPCRIRLALTATEDGDRP